MITNEENQVRVLALLRGYQALTPVTLTHHRAHNRPCTPRCSFDYSDVSASPVFRDNRQTHAQRFKMAKSKNASQHNQSKKGTAAAPPARIYSFATKEPEMERSNGE